LLVREVLEATTLPVWLSVTITIPLFALLEEVAKLSAAVLAIKKNRKVFFNVSTKSLKQPSLLQYGSRHHQNIFLR